jgi:SPP1 gp7 family putative phage head morphogenesis protein
VSKPSIIKISSTGRTQTLEILRAQVVLIRAAIASFRKSTLDNMENWLEVAREGYRAGHPWQVVHDLEHTKELQEIIVASRLGGRLQIRREARKAGIEAKPQPIFSEVFPKDKPPLKAIDWLKSLRDVTREQWQSTMAQYQTSAFFITGIEQKETLVVIKQAIQDSLAKGWTLSKFESEVRAQINDLALSGGRLRNVWHNQVTNAFNRGRDEEMKDPATRAVLSFYLFDAIVDGVVRPNHAALDNGIAPVDWAGWQQYKPMLGYNCRCARIAITAGRAKRMLESGEGWDMTLGVPAGAGPDPGYMRMV